MCVGDLQCSALTKIGVEASAGLGVYVRRQANRLKPRRRLPLEFPCACALYGSGYNAANPDRRKEGIDDTDTLPQPGRSPLGA